MIKQEKEDCMMNVWFKNSNGSSYEHGIDILKYQYDKCLNVNGDYIETPLTI